MGARPMQRLIQDTIRKALADELLFGRLTEGGRLSVDIGADEQVALDQPAVASSGSTRACRSFLGSGWMSSWTWS